MKTKYKISKLDPIFIKELNEIALKNTQVSGYKPSLRRVSKALRKHSFWNEYKQEIINHPLPDDRWKDE